MPAPKNKQQREKWLEHLRTVALKMGAKPPSRKGCKLTDEHKEKIRKTMMGNTHGFQKGHKMHIGRKKTAKEKKLISEKTKEAINNPVVKKKMIENKKVLRGKEHYNWKGGITPKNLQIRHSEKYRNWREKVFKRDNWFCQRCKKHGGKLEAHHIKSFAKYPKLRFIIKNGITLCKKCHIKEHGR